MNKIQELVKKGLITPPKWLPDNVMYETIMGSEAYGVSGGGSDVDIYGFAIPPKHIVFPHLAGDIIGFGRQKKHFAQYQQHHIFSQDDLGGKGRTYDITIYSIVKYFSLCMECNPNMIDSLFTPPRCIITRSKVWEMIQEQRGIFLHRGAWHKFKGYAYSQLHKIHTKNPEGKRKELVDKYGYDVKFAYHLVRLLSEVEQILVEHTLDLEKNREQLKAIRRGEWTLKQVEEFFYTKERELESLYTTSTLPHSPDEPAIKQLLLDCLEMHYGSLENCIVMPDQYRDTVLQIQELCDKAMKG